VVAPDALLEMAGRLPLLVGQCEPVVEAHLADDGS
jgi:hypothetical protein